MKKNCTNHATHLQTGKLVVLPVCSCMQSANNDIERYVDYYVFIYVDLNVILSHIVFVITYTSAYIYIYIYATKINNISKQAVFVSAQMNQYNK